MFGELDAMITLAVFMIVAIVFVGTSVYFNALNRLGFGIKKASDISGTGCSE